MTALESRTVDSFTQCQWCITTSQFHTALHCSFIDSEIPFIYPGFCPCVLISLSFPSGFRTYNVQPAPSLCSTVITPVHTTLLHEQPSEQNVMKCGRVLTTQLISTYQKLRLLFVLSIFFEASA